jgi:hypothetical protein
MQASSCAEALVAISQIQQLKMVDYKMIKKSLAQLSDVAPFVDNEDQSLSITALSLTNGSGTLKSVGAAVHGTVALNRGKVVFKPDPDFSGIATFQYTLVDSKGVATVHTATIDVAPVADTPFLSVSPANGVGAVTKQGSEFLVNTTTRGGQFLSSVASYPDGSYVMAWADTSGSGGDFSNAQIRAQRFNADGSRAGAEFRVNTTIDGDQNKPLVSVLANGNFVIAWQDASGEGGDASGLSVKAQMYHADGTKVGGEFLVNTTTQGDQNAASIAALANGGFVVSWVDTSGLGGDGSGSSIKAQMFDATGHKVGLEFLVNTTTLNDQDIVSVSALKSGGFVAIWQDNSFLPDDATRSGSILAQMFDANGNKVGGEILVDTKGRNFANDGGTVIGLSNGGFAVSWEASSNVGPDTIDSSIQMQIFDASGKKVGTEFQVNTSDIEYQRDPVMAELSNGDIVVVWKDESEENGDNNDYSVKAQVLDANGNRIGGEFLVNTTTLGPQQYPAVAALANGAFIVTWTDDSGLGGDSDGGVKAQIFSLGNAAENTPVKLNLAANVTDRDGSETLAVSVSNIPVGATLTDGVNSFTATAGQTSVDISSWSFGNLTVTPPLNFTGDFKLTVSATATDHATLTTGLATNSKTVSQTIDFLVAPLKGVISDETLSGGTVAENSTNGTVVGIVQGIDSLPGAILTYTLVDNANGRFAINANTGVITVADGSQLDFEAATSHGIKVQVKDQTGLSFVKTFNIAVTNVNEAPTDETLTGGSVVGNAADGTVVGTVHGIDPDAGSVLAYSLIDNAGGAFAIDAKTGIITVADGTKLDFTTATSHAIDVRVTDQGGLSFDKVFNITVTDPTKQLIAASEHATGSEDKSVVISAASLIADSSHPVDAVVSLTSVGNASHGTVSLVNGNVTFVPDANFSGIARFDYTLSDASGHSSTATVTVDVAPVADAPNLSVSTAGGSGGVTRIGGETQVNTTEAGGQFLSAIASYANGNYVVVWADTSYSGLGSAPRSDFAQIRGQFYDKSGNKIGGEFQVSTDNTVGQNNPKVSVLSNGDFAVVWQTEGASSVVGDDASGTGIKGQVFSADGIHTPKMVGSEFQVNSTTAGDQLTTSVTGLGNGRFVVTWQDNGADGTEGGDIKMRIFQDNGTGTPVPVANDFTANTVTLGAQQLPSVAALHGVNDGNYVAVWNDYGIDGQHSTRGDGSFSGTVIARLFDKDGHALSPELVVNAKDVDKFNDVAQVVGLRNGGFVVTWEAGEHVDPSTEIGPDTEDSSIHLRRFNADGSPAGGEIQVNTTGDEYQRAPRIVELTNGDLVVVWKDESQTNPDPTDYAVRAQVLDANGNKLGSEFVVNTITQGAEQMPDIAALPDGGFVVTWTDDSGLGHDTQDDAVKSQIFTVGSVAQNTAAKLNLAASLTDTDGSETLIVSVSNIPVGATLTDGVNTFTATTGHTTVDISRWSFGSLTVTPPPNFSGDFQLTVNATATDHATLTTGAVTDSKAVSQTIDIVVSPQLLQTQALVSSNTTGGTGNDVLFGGSGNDVLTGGGGNDTYQFGRGGGQDRIVNGTAMSTAASGELDLGSGIATNQLWFQRNGNDLAIEVMGSQDKITVAGWFNGAGSQLAEIKTADGMKIDAGLSQLIQAMASYSNTHAGFDPTAVAQAPTDSGLQNAITTNWHA